VETGLGIACQN